MEVIKFLENLPANVYSVALYDQVLTPPVSALIGSSSTSLTNLVILLSASLVRATLIALFQLLEKIGIAPSVKETCLSAQKQLQKLLDSKNQWLESFMNLTTSNSGIWLMSPAERSGSALQGALMFREGPRVQADGCETGDWSHVDVYLTKSLDYKALMFTGSIWDQQAIEWLVNRNSSFGSIGSYSKGNIASINIEDGDTLFKLLTELLIPELMSASLWHKQ